MWGHIKTRTQVAALSEGDIFSPFFKNRENCFRRVDAVAEDGSVIPGLIWTFTVECM